MISCMVCPYLINTTFLLVLYCCDISKLFANLPVLKSFAYSNVKKHRIFIYFFNLVWLRNTFVIIHNIKNIYKPSK